MLTCSKSHTCAKKRKSLPGKQETALTLVYHVAKVSSIELRILFLKLKVQSLPTVSCIAEKGTSTYASMK